MWGAVDTGYAIRQAIEMMRRRYRKHEVLFRQQTNLEEVVLWTRHVVLTVLSAVCSFNWSAASGDAGMCKPFIPRSIIRTGESPTPINILNVCIVFHRLFEAHFLPLHLSLILAAATVYTNVGGDLIPRELYMALYFCSICRLVGWALIVTYFYRYETYHRLCAELRREDMRMAGMKHEAAEEGNFSTRVFQWIGLFEAGIFPLGGFLYGAIPALQAVVSHMFTDRLTYHVSLKPQVNMQCWKDKTQ
jgi:hypothetical protein